MSLIFILRNFDRETPTSYPFPKTCYHLPDWNFILLKKVTLFCFVLFFYVNSNTQIVNIVFLLLESKESGRKVGCSSINVKYESCR